MEKEKYIELKGKNLSDKIKDECLKYIAKKNGALPVLATIRLGDNASDLSYERSIKGKFIDFGLEVKNYELPSDISDEEFKEVFNFINNDDEIDGILLFRPLPSQIDEEYVLRNLKKEKDLDGITRDNLAGLMMNDKDSYAPCTAEAVVRLLKDYDIELEGKNIAIIGRSLVVGKPLMSLLLNENATVTVAHSKTEDLKSITSSADIVVAAIGKAKAIGSSYLKKDAVLVDVGINVDEDGKLAGDCDFDTAKTVVSAISPVPGGVGVVTTAILAEHLLRAYKRVHGE